MHLPGFLSYDRHFPALLHLVSLCDIGINETFITWDIERIKRGLRRVSPRHVRPAVATWFEHRENASILRWGEEGRLLAFVVVFSVGYSRILISVGSGPEGVR